MAGAVISRQKFLTPSQVACIGKSKGHYYSFLLLTLARKPISLEQIIQTFPTILKDFETLTPIVEELERQKLVHRQNDEVRSISNDMKFPEPESGPHKQLHDQIDLWNLTFYRETKFENVVQKMLLRRVSSRYLSMIQAHSQVLLDLVRASDEIDSKYNDEVLMLNISIQKGHLPG